MNALLKNRQILYLFLCSFAVLYVGMGLFPILPIYAAQFGASNSVIGLYFSMMYVANAMGPVIITWLTGRVSRKKLFITAGLSGIPALALMGAVTSFWQVIVLTSVLWFAGGLCITLVSILAGQQTNTANRGKAFSLLSMAAPLGALAGGATIGPLVSWQGYPTMFMVLSVVWTAIPLIGLIGLLRLEDQSSVLSTNRAAQPAKPNRPSMKFNRDYYWLLVVSLLTAMAVNISRLAAPISMQSLAFTPADVSVANMISGLAAIPVILAVGTLADRLGRKHFLTTGILLALAGSLLLVNASQIWQFWLAAMLQLLAFSVNGAMGQALSTEIVTVENQGKGISWLNTTMSTANILCFAVGGVMIDTLGLHVVFLASAILAVIAAAALEGMVQTHSTAAKQPNFECNLREAQCS